MKITRFSCLKITIIIVLSGLKVYAQPNLPKEQIPGEIQADVRKQIQELYSTKPEERVWAAIRLASMGEKAVPAIPFLIGLLGDTKVAKIVDRSTELDEVEYHSPADKAAEALGSIGKPAVEALIAVINHKDARVRAYAALSLGYIKDVRSMELLIAALKDKEPSVRYYAALALGMIKDKRAVEPLIAALYDKEKSVRKSVASALGELKVDSAIKPLSIVFKKDRSRDVRSQAAISLGKLNAVKLLIDSLESSDYSRRYDAVIALGETKDDRALDVLTASLKDKDVSMQTQAAEALGKIKDLRALDPLIEALNDNNNTHVRLEIADALTEIGGRAAVETLIAVLKDKKSDIRVKAAISLGKLKDPIALEPLVAALNDFEGDDKSWAAEALGELGDPRAIEPLIAVLKDKGGIVGIISAEALAKIGKPALRPLLFALEDKDPDIRLGSARALGEMKASDAVEPLINVALKDVDQSVQNYAALSLWKIKDPLGLSVIVMPLTRALNDEYWVVRSRAAIALGEIRDPYGVEPLIDVLKNDKDQDVKKRAEIALEEITGKILGQDPEKWLKWWEENKDRFLNDR